MSVMMEDVAAPSWVLRANIDLALYRAHHAATVGTASPLALDLLRHERLDVEHLALRLRSDGKCSRWICGGRIVAAGMTTRYRGFTLRDITLIGEDAKHAFLHGGLEVRRWDDPAGGLGIRLSTAGLESARTSARCTCARSRA